MKTRGIFLSNCLYDLERVWAPNQMERLARWVELPPAPLQECDLEANRGYLQTTEVIFSTWGMPELSEDQLDLMPRLKAVFYAAGTVKKFAYPLFERGITVVSAAAANAVPVAEFALSQILFSLKLGWRHVALLKGVPALENWRHLDMPGVYESTVGIVSLGNIGRKLCELLEPFSVHKLGCDPHASDEIFRAMNVRRADLEEVFAESDVVSIHTPWLEETDGLVTGPLVASMKPNATLINTARGALIREAELIDVLVRRPDLTAVLDVTRPEPPALDSPLYYLPNVVLTPHIAGSAGREVRRMAELMIEEFLLWSDQRPLRYEVTPELLSAAA